MEWWCWPGRGWGGAGWAGLRASNNERTVTPALPLHRGRSAKPCSRRCGINPTAPSAGSNFHRYPCITPAALLNTPARLRDRGEPVRVRLPGLWLKPLSLQVCFSNRMQG